MEIFKVMVGIFPQKRFTFAFGRMLGVGVLPESNQEISYFEPVKSFWNRLLVSLFLLHPFSLVEFLLCLDKKARIFVFGILLLWDPKLLFYLPVFLCEIYENLVQFLKLSAVAFELTNALGRNKASNIRFIYLRFSPLQDINSQVLTAFVAIRHLWICPCLLLVNERVGLNKSKPLHRNRTLFILF